jgi:uncharacterized DUF497 family protein
MATIRFEWDPAKARANFRKHGVSFEEARSAFGDEPGRVIPEEAGVSDESRLVLLGMSYRLRILVVCHTYREADEVIRIVSARCADRSEREQYSRYLP